MLYRPVHQPARVSFFARLGLVLGAARLGRRRRLAALELRSLSPHLRRDLGLQDASFLDP